MVTRVRLKVTGSLVCDDWKSFDNFTRWYAAAVKQPKWQLDKDLLNKGNKIYSPEFCVFLPQEINKAIAGQNKTKSGELPTGVSKHNNRYRAKCKDSNGGEWWESFTSIQEASLAYKTKKKQILVNLAEKYKDSLDIRAYLALLSYQF